MSSWVLKIHNGKNFTASLDNPVQGATIFAGNFLFFSYPLGTFPASVYASCYLLSHCAPQQRAQLSSWYLLLGTSRLLLGLPLISRVNKPSSFGRFSWVICPIPVPLCWIYLSLSLLLSWTEGSKTGRVLQMWSSECCAKRSSHILDQLTELLLMPPTMVVAVGLLYLVFSVFFLGVCGNASWMSCRMLLMCFLKNAVTFFLSPCPLAVK